MKYILDFDHTLMDTDTFVEQVEDDGLLDILITPSIWRKYNVRDFLYEDVLDWLASKNPTDVYILTAVTPSLGPLSEKFQKEKLRSGKFDDYVSGITFMTGEKGGSAVEIAEQFPPNEQIIFVDDKIDQCLSVQAALPKAIICLMIRDSEESQENPFRLPGIYTVHDLTEVDGIIEQI